jgi:hypothetical protein
MSQHNIPDGLFHEVWQLYSNGHTSDEILARLMKREVDLEVAEGVMSKVKSIRDAKRRRQGLTMCIIGGVLLVMAFFVTYILHQFNVQTDIALYGLTTVGIGCLFTGMVFYMG